MRVLVTGAQGCIGSWVVRSLLNRNIDVLIYDLVASTERLEMLAPIETIKRAAIETGRIEDTDRIKSIVKDGGITHIVHLAAQLMPFCQQNPVAGGMMNVIGTLNVFEAARDSGRNVRVVYASSSAVWGPGEAYEDKPLSEDQPLKPATHYGVFKQANEGNARVFYSHNGISSIGLRPWTVYGVGRDYGLTADPTIAIKAVALGKPFQIRLTGFMDFQYVEDVAETFVRCLLSPVEGAHVFNLMGEVHRMEDFVELIADVDPEAARRITCAGPQVPVAFRMDGTQLQTHIPGIPRTSLSDGVRKTLEMFRDLRAAGKLTETLSK
jgi:nucleoside-diphosphate-sugar epimerase